MKSECSLGCETHCQARAAGCASECPALPWQPVDPAELRLEITVRDADGAIVEHYIGPSIAERKALHEQGNCDYWCSFCITEAENAMDPAHG